MHHLHHASWVHANHHANPAEGRVFLLVVSDVPQRRTPAACNIKSIITRHKFHCHSLMNQFSFLVNERTLIKYAKLEQVR